MDRVRLRPGYHRKRGSGTLEVVELMMFTAQASIALRIVSRTRRVLPRVGGTLRDRSSFTRFDRLAGAAQV